MGSNKMRGNKHHPELSDDDKDHIRIVFTEEVVPRLTKLQARRGTLSCDFADPRFRPWTIHFRSQGSDFEIVDFAYDEDADSMDLDL